MPRAADILAATILVAATVLVNAHTLDYGFVYDDNAVILERIPAARQGWRAFAESRPWGLGRHLTVLSLDANRGTTTPPDPRPFHITNTALAAVVSLMVFVLGRSLGLTTFAASAGALFFAVHPVHVDAVVSIVGRAELLAATFVLAAVVLHVNGYPPRGWGVIAALLFFFAGLESKESAACLPLLVLVYDLTRIRARGIVDSASAGVGEKSPRTRSKNSLWLYAGYAAVLVAWLAFAGSRLSAASDIDFIDNPLAFMPIWERILNACSILWRYAGLLAWPAGLRSDRSFDQTATAIGPGVVALVAWIAAALAVWRLRKSKPTCAFLLAWFPIAFVVTGNVLVPIGTIMADRLDFLPSVGPCLIAGALLQAVGRGGRVRRGFATGVLAVSAFVLALGYRAHSLVWASELHFYRQTVVDSPHSAKAHYNLALGLARAGHLSEAARSFRRAIEIYPKFYLATEYLARTLIKQKHEAQAADAYESYLRNSPDDQRALVRYSNLLLKLGRYQEARRSTQHLLTLDPTNRDYLMLRNRSESATKHLSP